MSPQNLSLLTPFYKSVMIFSAFFKFQNTPPNSNIFITPFYKLSVHAIKNPLFELEKIVLSLTVLKSASGKKCAIVAF